MAWGSKIQISSAVTVNSTTKQDRSTAIALDPGETVHIQVEADFPTTPTSHLLVYVETTLDEPTENWSDSPSYGPFLISNTIDPNAKDIFIQGPYKLSLIYALNTGTDSVTVNAWYRKNGISL